MANWTHILTLLAYAVLIDERVYKEEVECFTQQALILQQKLTPDMLFSRKMAFDWFMAHRDGILANLRLDGGKASVLVPIKGITGQKERQYILAAMHIISESDGELHNKETNLEALCKTHWGL